MKKYYLIALLLISCGQKSHSELKLTDATVIKNSSHPAVMQIAISNSNCTASAISESLIITSKHCLKGDEDVSIVVAGDKSLYGLRSSFLFTYKDILKDREFTRLNRTLKDLAIVYFSGRPFKDFLKVDSESTLEHGTRVDLIGFGQSDAFLKTGSGVKRLGSNLVFSHSEKEILSTTSSQGEKGLFSDHSESPLEDMFSLIAKGDSGGPMLYKNKIVGIASNSTTGFLSEASREGFRGANSYHTPLNNRYFRELYSHVNKFVSDLEKTELDLCDLKDLNRKVVDMNFVSCMRKGKEYSCLEDDNSSCVVKAEFCKDNYDSKKDFHPYESPVLECSFYSNTESCHVYFSEERNSLSVCRI